MQGERTTKQEIAVPFLHVDELLEHYARHTPDAAAIFAPDRPALSYSALHQQTRYVGGALRGLGLASQDRVAVVLPNGPEIAVAVLGVAANATCIPINPAYGAEELNRNFDDVQPRALITQVDSPASRVALSRGVQVVALSTTGDMPAGVFALTTDHATLTSDQGNVASRETVGLNDVALLMTTSGTTSRPKIVPLTHVNICSAACSWGTALALTKSDRCLNVMPLFHGHGLIGTVLASLAAGASVVCTPGCDTNRFFSWLTEFRPTWYSAVPTMHQAIVAEARRHPERSADHRLRFVRSGSAPLPPHVIAGLEETFATCVIEFCGITETAASPVACNPLPPRLRKVGSIGVPVELEVAIIDEDGASLPSGQAGQVIVRGASVMSSYDGDSVATAEAFAGDWFKTGDLGFFDDDGYLFLAGRIKEIINRGGQKIAPTQVDEVLLQHPAVAEAVTFAVPHPTLGEDVAAAIVLRPRVNVTPKDIRQFAFTRLAAFKVPRQVQIVAEIPKGPTGKVLRTSMADKLGLATGVAIRQGSIKPSTPLEKTLAGIWAEVLQVEQVGRHDNFFALGGDSLLATRALHRVHEITGLEVEVVSIFEAPTVAELAEFIEPLIHAATSRTPLDMDHVPRQNGVVDASFAQQTVWELKGLLPELPLFNILYVLRITSPCDAAVLEKSINEIVRRHEILRTTFTAVAGRLVQVIAPELRTAFRFDDLGALPPLQIEAAVRELVQEELFHSFDLERGPLISPRLARLAERSHLLLIAMPGMIEDGWSLGVLVNELTTLYDAFSAGKASPLVPLPLQYADFAEWQRRWPSNSDLVAQLTYWEEQLRDPLPVMKLTKGLRRRKIDDFTTARRQVALPTELSQAAKDFSQREGVTLFMTLMAAFKTLLHCYTGLDDLRVATDVANRNRSGTENLIGPIANTVILRTHLQGDPSVRAVIQRVRAATLGALANQDIRFEAVAEALERDRAVNPAAIAQVKMSLLGPSLRAVAGSDQGLKFEEVVPGMALPLVTLTTFDVTLTLRDTAKALVGTCVYKPHLFGDRAVDRLLQDFQRVLEQMVVQPERPISAIAASLNQRN